MEDHLEKPAGKVALEKFYTDKADLVSVLLSAANIYNLSPTYGTRVLKFFNKLFHLAEKNPSDKSYEGLCLSLSRVATIETTVLQDWLSKMIMGSAQQQESLDDGNRVQENRLLLQSLTTYIVKENSHVGEEVAKAILNALIPMGSQILSPTSEGIGFSDLMVVMATLAGAGSGSGHTSLFQAVTGWLELCKTYLAQKNVIEKIQENVTAGKHQMMLESACYLLSYISDILAALKQSSDRFGAASPPYDGEYPIQDSDLDWAEDEVPPEDDSAAEDSDEESLNNKLCTFTVTQKEFMNQHWYHCHTCKMVDGVGVCTVCAKVCHKDHELSYAKYGSFFCDCGAKEDGVCQALIKRTLQSGIDSSRGAQPSPSPFSLETMLISSLRRRLSIPSSQEDKHPTEQTRRESEKVSKAREALCKQLEGVKEGILNNLTHSGTVEMVLELLQSLMPGIVENYQKMSPLGSKARAQNALHELKTLPKVIETSDQLMTATLGSQEGAFENVRMNYSGDQGQTIRQLITSHVLRRVAMCCLTSPHGKRQHLAVSHEKGKVTILQLSALLKQADSSKRKLTLTRLASAPIPFTVLSIAGNPSNEDFLAVCGLKDCHVLTFSSTGCVADHLVLHPSLETGNFIIKALWLPGSQTDLAIVTADFVKIYSLSQDAISPQYYFLLPSGKIRDATFVFSEETGCHLLLMSSSGYIYTQPMDESSSAQHGPFYITNILEVNHPDIKEAGGQVAGGGVSVYYSHTLQLLFFSYTQGKTFAAPVPKEMEELPILFPIPFKSSNGGGKSGNNAQPLVQWMEVINHPGLVCAMTQGTNNPIILMVKPDTILIQEIKVLPAKAKIQDMVAIRHPGSNSDQRTTLILLCEDGSLRIYMANIDHTNYWMSPSFHPQSAITVLKPKKKKVPTATLR